MSETDADQTAETPEQPRRVRGGTAEGTDAAHQADTASTDPTGQPFVVKNPNAWHVETEPPCTEPFARWCGRTAGAIPPPTRSRHVLFVGGASPLSNLMEVKD